MRHRIEKIRQERGGLIAFCSVCGDKARVVEIPAPTKRNPDRKKQVCVASLMRWRGSKWRNVPYTSGDGRSFQSTKEGRRYEQLRAMERAGEIRDLRCQVPIRIEVNGVLIKTYRADFSYCDGRTGEVIYEDVKGFPTREWVLTRKLLKAIGIEVREVR